MLLPARDQTSSDAQQLTINLTTVLSLATETRLRKASKIPHGLRGVP